MTLSVDLFWSFRSPYSYLSTERLSEIAGDYDVDINFRPVYPIAVRIDGFFETVNPLWPPYVFRDSLRLAEMTGMPFRWPSPDPIVQDLATRTVSKDQPYIYRLTRAGQAASDRGKGLAFANEVSHVIFGGTQNWHEGDHLRDAAARAGLDMDELDAATAADPDGYDAKISTNQDALEAAGHWGVPTIVFEGEPFFGQDRIDTLLWRMEQKGLEKRS